MPAPFLALLDLLLQSVELWRGEELSQSDAETVAEEFDGQKLGILALAIEDILHAGGRQALRVASLLMLMFRSSQSCRMRSRTALTVFTVIPPGAFSSAYRKTLAKIGYACYYRAMHSLKISGGDGIWRTMRGCTHCSAEPSIK